MEFSIKLNLAGRDKIGANFDLGVDALAFGLDASGGVELSFGYNFSLGFGVNLQNGFYVQLNPNVNYVNGLPVVVARRNSACRWT